MNRRCWSRNSQVSTLRNRIRAFVSELRLIDSSSSRRSSAASSEAEPSVPI